MSKFLTLVNIRPALSESDAPPGNISPSTQEECQRERGVGYFLRQGQVVG